MPVTTKSKKSTNSKNISAEDKLIAKAKATLARSAAMSKEEEAATKKITKSKERDNPKLLGESPQPRLSPNGRTMGRMTRATARRLSSDHHPPDSLNNDAHEETSGSTSTSTEKPRRGRPPKKTPVSNRGRSKSSDPTAKSTGGRPRTITPTKRTTTKRSGSAPKHKSSHTPSHPSQKDDPQPRSVSPSKTKQTLLSFRTTTSKTDSGLKEKATSKTDAPLPYSEDESTVDADTFGTKQDNDCVGNDEVIEIDSDKNRESDSDKDSNDETSESNEDEDDDDDGDDENEEQGIDNDDEKITDESEDDPDDNEKDEQAGKGKDKHKVKGNIDGEDGDDTDEDKFYETHVEFHPEEDEKDVTNKESSKPAKVYRDVKVVNVVPGPAEEARDDYILQHAATMPPEKSDELYDEAARLKKEEFLATAVKIEDDLPNDGSAPNTDSSGIETTGHTNPSKLAPSTFPEEQALLTYLQDNDNDLSEQNLLTIMARLEAIRKSKFTTDESTNKNPKDVDDDLTTAVQKASATKAFPPVPPASNPTVGTYSSAVSAPQSALRNVRFEGAVSTSGPDDPAVPLQYRRIRATVCTEPPESRGEMLKLILMRLGELFIAARRSMEHSDLQGKKKKYIWIRPFHDTTKPKMHEKGTKEWRDKIDCNMPFVDFKKYFDGALYENSRARGGKWYFRFTIVVPECEEVDAICRNVSFNLKNSNEKLQDLTTSQHIFDPFKVGFLHRSNRQLAYDTELLDETNCRLEGDVYIGFSWATISKVAPGQVWSADKAIYAIVIECNKSQLQSATTQLKRIFPLSRSKGYSPPLKVNLAYSYLDNHPDVKNNHVALSHIGKLITRQKIHLKNEILMSTTAIIPGSLNLPILQGTTTLHSLLMNVKSTITENGMGGKIFHSITYNHSNQAHTTHFTCHCLYQTEAESIVGSLPLFLRDELKVTNLEDYVTGYTIEEGDKWKVETRSVDNAATRWLEQAMNATEDLSGGEDEDDAIPPPTTNATKELTEQERKEFERQTGLNDSETFVDHMKRNPATTQQNGPQRVDISAVSVPSDTMSLVSGLGAGSVTGRSVVSGKSIKTIDAQKEILDQCQAMIANSMQTMMKGMSEQIAAAVKLSMDPPHDNATGGHPGSHP